MVYFVQNVQKYRRYKEFEIYVEISTGTTISQEMLKQTLRTRWCLSSFATSSNDLTNQRLLRHVISRDYITHEFCVIPKQYFLATIYDNLQSVYCESKVLGK